MRTDSPRVAAEAQTEARDVIAARYGPRLSSGAPFYRARKSAQEAHEAIRPTLLDHRRSAWPVTWVATSSRSTA